MCWYEIDEERYLRDMREDAEERGMEAGMKRGMEAGMKQGMEAGMKQGMEAGIQQGIKAGEMLGRIRLVRKKIQKGLSVFEIAELLEVDEEMIGQIYNLLKEHMDEDDEQILEYLNE